MVCWVILAAQRIIFFHVACRWNHGIDKHHEKRFYMERYLIIAPLADFIFLRGKQTQNLECLISWAVSAEYAGLGVVSRKWRKQTYQESRTRPAGTMWWCLMGISHHEPAFYQILSFFPHKEVVMWKKIWLQSIDQAMPWVLPDQISSSPASVSRLPKIFGMHVPAIQVLLFAGPGGLWLCLWILLSWAKFEFFVDFVLLEGCLSC